MVQGFGQQRVGGVWPVRVPSGGVLEVTSVSQVSCSWVRVSVQTARVQPVAPGLTWWVNMEARSEVSDDVLGLFERFLLSSRLDVVRHAGLERLCSRLSERT